LGEELKIINQNLPWSTSLEHKRKREQLFKYLDIDNNKYLRLIECKEGMRKLEIGPKIVNDDIILKIFELSVNIKKKSHAQK